MTTKQLSRHAATAKAIREELKKLIKYKAKVKSDSFSMGNSVDITLIDETPEKFKEITSVLKQYQYGHFNSQEDIYVDSNRKDIPQVKWVSVNNFPSQYQQMAIKKYIAVMNYSEEILMKKYGLYNGSNDNDVLEHRFFANNDWKYDYWQKANLVENLIQLELIQGVLAQEIETLKNSTCTFEAMDQLDAKEKHLEETKYLIQVAIRDIRGETWDAVLGGQEPRPYDVVLSPNN